MGAFKSFHFPSNFVPKGHSAERHWRLIAACLFFSSRSSVPKGHSAERHWRREPARSCSCSAPWRPGRALSRKALETAWCRASHASRRFRPERALSRKALETRPPRRVVEWSSRGPERALSRKALETDGDGLFTCHCGGRVPKGHSAEGHWRRVGLISFIVLLSLWSRKGTQPKGIGDRRGVRIGRGGGHTVPKGHSAERHWRQIQGGLSYLAS